MSGICGIFSKDGDCFSDLLLLTDYHSHLGTEFGGMAVKGKGVIKDKVHRLQQGNFKERFVGEGNHLKGRYGIGVISDLDTQPVTIKSKNGVFSLVTSGRVNNIEEIVQEMESQNHSFGFFRTIGKNGEERILPNITEVVAKILTTQANLMMGVEEVYRRIEGSLSMLLLGDKGVYAIRDKRGTTPLFLGRRGNDLAITTEDFPLHNLDFKVERMLKAGEFLRISESGVKQKMEGDDTQSRICSFLFVYTAFPAATLCGKNAQLSRIELGKALARGETGEYDQVMGVQDSGKYSGIGFAEESGKPLRDGLMKYAYSWGGRSFTPPNQDDRDRYGRMKQVPVPALIEGKRILVTDDSIVRGTQLAQTVRTKLWSNGAKEVHVRISCPPLMYGCPFLNSTRRNELIARRVIDQLEGHPTEDIGEYLNPESPKYVRLAEAIRKEEGFTSLRYQTLKDMVDAIGLPQCNLCTYCFNGKE